MKRWLVLLVVALFVLSGCARAPAPAAEPAPKPVLTVIGPWSGPEMEAFLPVLKAAEEKVGARINYRIYRAEDLASILPAQFEAAQAPGDVIFMWDWWVKENAQHAVDLADVWQSEAGQFILEAAEAEGKVCAVPYAMTVKPGFWYRKSFFQQHHLKPPTTWEELKALLEQVAGLPGIKKPIVTGDGVGWPISDITEHFLIACGGPQLQLDLIAGKVKWTDAQVRSVFADRLVPLLPYFSDPVEWTQAIDLWWNGEYALYFMGNWLTGMVKQPDDLGVFTLPGAKGVVAGTDYAFIPKYSENVDAARKLVAFLISREGMETRAKQGGKLAGRKDVPADVYPPADKALAEALAQVEVTLPDLDDSIGGDWQRTFWDQLKLLWVRPKALDEVLTTLESKRQSK
ncbi:MAG: ABC transporter substrate-binding protein [Bacillota bacterium]|nr:ABC transporter substrate-binding protein [Bacillota bacterium]MDI7249655.1 ABC transporter substrate-binding protein [Bacillota bacterium]